MTSTTTLKLSDELKARIASAAQQTGKTAHAFMVEALELQTELAERRSASFQCLALVHARESDLLPTSRTT
jgi:predicted transcriptional regulator